MPDEVKPPNGEASPLEMLIAEAESQTQVPLQDHPRPCTHINVELKPCPTCGWSYCTTCASTLDPNYCRLCLAEPDVAIRQQPLVDVDGVTHTGREMIPEGPRYASTLRNISEMSDPELEAYIKQYQDLVHAAEVAMDFRKIVLGAANIESAQRADAKRRALRADKQKYPIHSVTLDPKTGKQVKKTASSTAVADMLKMMEALQALKKMKDAQAAAKAKDAKP